MTKQVKGSDAAMKTGTESAVYAAEASDSNDLLDQVLPATVCDYVELVKAHIDAGVFACSCLSSFFHVIPF